MTDPFWAEVRRLLPAADAVVLPAPDPAPEPADSALVTAIRARQARDAAHAALSQAWAWLVPVPPPTTARRAWRTAAPDGRLVRLELIARHEGTVPGSGVAAVLAAARAAVESAAGPVDIDRWTTAGGLRLVTAVAGHGVDLYGTTDPVGLTLTILSPPLAVPAALGADLVVAGAEQVPFG